MFSAFSDLIQLPSLLLSIFLAFSLLRPLRKAICFGFVIQLLGSISGSIVYSHKRLLTRFSYLKWFLLHFSKNHFVYKKFAIRGAKNGQTLRENLEKSAQNALQLSSSPVEHPSDYGRYLFFPLGILGTKKPRNRCGFWVSDEVSICTP